MDEFCEQEITEGHKVFYLPHRSVIRESAETTKLKIVYDASSKPTENSLLSLHSFHEDKILFYYCYYIHYAMITTRNKLIFIPTLLSLHICHEAKTTQLS